MRTARQYAEAIRRADFKGDRETYLDLWEEVAANSSSANRLYEAVADEIARMDNHVRDCENATEYRHMYI